MLFLFLGRVFFACWGQGEYEQSDLRYQICKANSLSMFTVITIIRKIDWISVVHVFMYVYYVSLYKCKYDLYTDVYMARNGQTKCFH